eukprot:TRINITY_DN15610_c0_g1_i6.p3 TRINITY_DN15610_c0_g1~~TRINITY_DN15610_c0_g1_i6.p3  ORF type:complete len:103 (-),score=24.95 TRINITY_DN15610_c0_g1_i6:327-635(-)
MCIRDSCSCMLLSLVRWTLTRAIATLQALLNALPSPSKAPPVSQWTLETLHDMARDRLPAHVWKYEAFDGIELMTRVMAGLAPSVDTSISLFGKQLSSPVTP